MKKRFMFLTAFVLTLTLAACAPKDEGGTTTPDPNPNPGVVDKSQTLIIYSNSASNGRGEFLTEKAKEAGFNIEVVSISGGDLANRLILEKNNSVADLVYGLNTLEYERLKAENILKKYDAPEWTKGVDLSLGDDEGYYYPIVIQPLVGVGNKDIQMPKDWYELATDSKWKGKYNLFGLGGGTARSMLAAFLQPYRDDNGEHGVSKEGWELVKQYVRNGSFLVDGDDYIGNVISGEVPISQLWGSGVIQNQNERDYKFQILAPDTGVAFVVEQTAIIANSKKTALSEEFIKWFGTAEIQSEWSEKFGSIPAHEDAAAKTSEDIQELLDKVKPIDIDWGYVGKNLDAWIQKIELEFIQ